VSSACQTERGPAHCAVGGPATFLCPAGGPRSAVEPFTGFGAKTVKIEYSPDGTAWTPLADVPEFKKASGKAGYMADTKISFGGVPAKVVKLTIEKNWGTAPRTGLSEVRFFAAQSAAATQP